MSVQPFTYKVYLKGTDFQTVESLRHQLNNRDFEVLGLTDRCVTVIYKTEKNAEILERLGVICVPLSELKYA